MVSHSGKCMEVASLSTQDGGLIQQWDCAEGFAQQRWRVEPHGSAVALINQLSDKCLDVPGSSTGDVPLAQYGCHFGANQLWYH